ncbi:hypothetical protein BU26DRAFT_109008 [Trematosphaeria pertusa]|uniref:Nuclear membrane fusion protein Kar5 n=1 Tax=Trematosphaeria pertusa TaxID=390896 RepID=A0A6A6I0G9_9PLEO|nr:uncharacterized protein BU26DRAFT_109008 [Trematosphaeria pertusa]KAF2243777.1 hypothetical protein BU26DRAFT_109008 [Trematosphaeria pertusa]
MRFGIGAVAFAVLTGLHVAKPAVHNPYPGTTNSTQNLNLVDLLHSSSVEHQKNYVRAIQILEKTNTQPICQRRAAMNLINDCRELEQQPNHDDSKTEEALEFQKDAYATRLAVCEIDRAKARIPDACSVATLSSEACHQKQGWRFYLQRRSHNSTTELCYPQASPKQVAACMKALHDKPQDWTSFSNARQNALTMCQASRDAMEREKTLSQYKSLSDAIEHMSQALFKAMKNFHEERLNQERFAEQVKLTEEETFQAVRRVLSSVGDLGAYVEALTSETVLLRSRVNATFANARENVMAVYKDLAKAGLEFAKAKDVELYGKLQQAIDEIGSLKDLVDEIKDKAADTVVTLHEAKEDANAVVQSVRTTHQLVDAIFQRLNTAMAIMDRVENMIRTYIFTIAWTITFVGSWATYSRIAGWFTLVSGAVFMVQTAEFWKQLDLVVEASRLFVVALMDGSPDAVIGTIVVNSILIFCYWRPIAATIHTLFGAFVYHGTTTSRVVSDYTRLLARASQPLFGGLLFPITAISRAIGDYLGLSRRHGGALPHLVQTPVPPATSFAEVTSNRLRSSRRAQSEGL